MEELYKTLVETKKLLDLLKNFNDKLWSDFHNGNINHHDDFYTLLHEWIENAVNNHDCEAILENNSKYHHNEHDIFGIPEKIDQAAYACLYDYLTNSPDAVTFAEMEKPLL